MDDPEEYEQAPDHMKGTSAVQFITTSNVTIHTVEVPRKVFVNIFTCKEFDPDIARAFTEEWFRGKIVNGPDHKGYLIERM